MSDPEFGERTGQDDPKASCAVYVHRPLNEYSPFEEVFEFRAVEPEVSQADRDGKQAFCRYHLTREERNNVPGVDTVAATAGRMAIVKVPEEVKQRAAAMVDFIDPDPEWYDDDEDDES